MSEYLLKRRAAMMGLKVPDQKKAATPIAKVSDKRKVVNRLYKKIIKEMAAESNLCELKSPVCTGIMQGGDHIQKRSPNNLTDRNNLKRACNACNQFKETFPNWAIDNGHSKSKFVKN